jgi:hypothetical protein
MDFVAGKANRENGTTIKTIIMKKTVLFILALASIQWIMAQKVKRYDVKSGIIEYKTSTGHGSVVSEGTKTVAFTDFGARESIQEDYNEGDQTVHKFSLFNNGMVYIVDYDAEKIYQKADPMAMMHKEFGADMGNTGEEMLKAMGGKKIGNEKFLGYDCELWQFPGGKQWIYKGVMLKSEIKIMGVTTIEEAVSAKFNIVVDEELFNLPGFEIVDMMGGLPATMDVPDEEDFSPEEVEMMRNMTYEEFKVMLKEEDPEEFENIPEENLRIMYNEMKKWAESHAGGK